MSANIKFAHLETIARSVDSRLVSMGKPALIFGSKGAFDPEIEAIQEQYRKMKKRIQAAVCSVPDEVEDDKVSLYGFKD